MTNPIYDQHDKAFNRVAAYVIMQGNERVATVAFKFPADGAGRLYCYLHVIGLPMVRGMASGYGYDKKSAAFEDAARKQAVVKLEDWQDPKGYQSQQEVAAMIAESMAGRDGYEWSANLHKAGFTVIQAV
jgi:hypothetical protein